MSTTHPWFTARIDGAPETIFDLIAQGECGDNGES